MPLNRLERQNQMCSNLTKPSLSPKSGKNTKELEKQICSQFSKAANFKIIFSFSGYFAGEMFVLLLFSSVLSSQL